MKSIFANRTYQIFGAVVFLALVTALFFTGDSEEITVTTETVTAVQGQDISSESSQPVTTETPDQTETTEISE
tara:strand:- start:294 stop:512 length:219 start_codon:yes stop_codon:yes gene_type:complete